MGYGDPTANYKTTLRKEVISVLRGQAMLGLLNNQHPVSSYSTIDQKGSLLMKDQCETLLASGHVDTNSQNDVSPVHSRKGAGGGGGGIIIRGNHNDDENISKGIQT